MSLLALAVSSRGVVDPDEPAVFADDEAFLRGRGAFETMRVYRGRAFRLSDHLTRLEASARRLGLPDIPRSLVEQLVADALAAADQEEALVRVYCTPGREGTGSPIAFVLVRALPPELEDQRRRGLALASIEIGLAGPGLLGGVKSTSYAINMVAADEAKWRGADDALLVGVDRVVLECPTSNIWWRRDHTLCTPRLELGILAGVTRGLVIELAAGLGYHVHEGAFPLDDVAAAKEVFTSSSVREVMPVASLDGTAFDVGPAARKLQDALRRAAATR